jgi:Flagellar protein FliT
VQQQRQQQWQNILSMTERLHQLSADENWQDMMQLESQRFDILQRFFSTPVTEAEVMEVEAGIRQMMKSDEQLKQFSVRQQKDLSDGVRKMAVGRQAIKAYGHFQT